jgi:predicted dehydrogenase
MKQHKIGIIMNGVTGRMGTNQHLMRSIVEIIREGGVPINQEEVIIPDPVLVGRNMAKLEKLRQMSGIQKITTNLDEVMNDPDYQIYFDQKGTCCKTGCGRRQACVL